jgi:protein-tyrosine phosphatase
LDLVAETYWRILALAALRRARERSLAKVTHARPTRLLVVCHGNIYRSAFVGEWLRLHAPRGIVVRSAGLHPHSGRSSPDRQVAMARERGVDLSRHSSIVLGPADHIWAQIVVLMDRKNWVGLRRLGVEPEKLVWLGAFAPGAIEIADPYRMDDAAASALLDRLASCAGGLLRHVTAGGDDEQYSRTEQPTAKLD